MPIKILINIQLMRAGRQVGQSSGNLADDIAVDDGLEWPILLSSSWMANLILYVMAALAYRHPLRIGATYLRTSGVLLAIWLLLIVLMVIIQGLVMKRSLVTAAAGDSA
jgi:hypothetical protein